MKTILVVDDEPKIVQLVRDYLERAGFAVYTADDGKTALALARSQKPDLVVLDLGLPELDGLDVIRQLRKISNVPVIILTARAEESDKLVGLELGADDYVCKPFSVRELMARIKAVLRRAVPGEPDEAGSSILQGPGGLRLDVERRTAAVNKTVLDLTRLEFDLLQRLLVNAGRVLTRERLLEQVWNFDFTGDTRAVDSAIKRLRAKLRLGAPEADSVEAVRGVGYRIRG